MEERKMCSTKRLGWESLPSDLLVEIFSRLSVVDKLSAVPLVCKSWYQASLNPSIWKAISFYNSEYRYWKHFSRLMDIASIRGGAAVERIHFRLLIIPSLGVVAKRCPNVRFFYLHDYSSKKKSVKFIREAIRHWKKLEGMEIGQFYIRRQVLEEVSNNCKNFHTLRVVGTLQREQGQEVVQWLPHLKRFKISSCYWNGQLITILKGCKELEYLDITHCGSIWTNFPDFQELGSRLKIFLHDKV